MESTIAAAWVGWALFIVAVVYHIIMRSEWKADVTYYRSAQLDTGNVLDKVRLELQAAKKDARELEMERRRLKFHTKTAAIYLKKAVCVEGQDSGVILLSAEGTTHYDEKSKCQVYDHEHISELGDALVHAYHALHKATSEVEEVDEDDETPEETQNVLEGRVACLERTLRERNERVSKIEKELEPYRGTRPGTEIEIARLRDCANAWEKTAGEYARGLDYYKGELKKICELFGVDAYICDDGSRSDSVLVAKAFDLVKGLAEKRLAPKSVTTEVFDSIVRSRDSIKKEFEDYQKATRDADNGIMGKICGGLKDRDYPSRGLHRDIDLLFAEIDRLNNELKESEANREQLMRVGTVPGATHVGEKEWVDLYAVLLRQLDAILRGAMRNKGSIDALVRHAHLISEHHRELGEKLTALDAQMTSVAKKLGRLEPEPASEALTDVKRAE